MTKNQSEKFTCKVTMNKGIPMTKNQSEKKTRFLIFLKNACIICACHSCQKETRWARSTEHINHALRMPAIGVFLTAETDTLGYDWILVLIPGYGCIWTAGGETREGVIEIISDDA